MPIYTNQNSCLDALYRAVISKHTYLWLHSDAISPKIFDVPWREIWTEHNDGTITTLIQERQSQGNMWPVSERQVLPVANDPEDTVTGAFSYDRLLPVFFLNGLKEDKGKISSRRWHNIRERMLEFLSEIRKGVFFIAGGESTEIWEVIFRDIFDEGLLPDIQAITVIIAGVPDLSSDQMKILSSRKQEVYLWHGKSESLIANIAEQTVHSGIFDNQHQIRIGDQIIGIDNILVGVTRRLDDDFYIIENHHLDMPTKVDKELLNRFLSDADPCWGGFAANFAFPRDYAPLKADQTVNKAKSLSLFEQDKAPVLISLTDLVERSLELASMDSGKNITITIPAEPGSGITTSLWATSYQMAQKGYPVLILKPGIREIDFSALSTFLTGLSRRARKHGTDPQGKLAREIPLLLVFDMEHQAISLTRELASQLKSDGRLCVVLRAVEPLPDLSGDDSRNVLEKIYNKARGPELWCEKFQATITTREEQHLPRHFEEIVKKYNMDFELPDNKAWTQYQRNHSITIERNREEAAENLFWICLYFFLLKQVAVTNRMDTHIQDSAKLATQKNPQLGSYIISIAVATTFRLALPTRVLARAYSQDNWVALSEDISKVEEMIPYLTRDYGADNEEFLRFRHPQYARVILNGYRKQIEYAVKQLEEFPPPAFPNYPVEWLHHLISHLEPGIDSHRGFGKLVATQVLKLEGKRRELNLYGEQLLAAFEAFPAHFVQQSQTVLQANAITLSKTASRLVTSEGRNRFMKAEEKMLQALEIAADGGFIEENPRILKTTLANIYEVWSRREAEWGDRTRADLLAQKAGELYREVIKDWPESPYARYGYSLLLHQKYLAIHENDEQSGFQYLLEALECLDTKPDYDFEDQWENHRSRILSIISNEKARGHVDKLMKNGMEIGFILAARSVLGELETWNDETREKAIAILEEAENCAHPSSNPNSRIALMYRLMSEHSTRKWNYPYRYRLLSKLYHNGYSLSTHMRYEFAVLCYQLDRQDEGEQTFSSIRRGKRYLQLDLEKHEYWRDYVTSDAEPIIKRSTMRVESIDTSGYNGWTRVNGLKRLIPFNPTHPWRGQLKVKATVPCIVRFRASGPQALPPDFLGEGGSP